MSIKLPYGLKDGVLVHIQDIQERGLACNCICSACGAMLVARKGNKKNHHFAHYKSPECKHAVQTALHLAAKEIIAQEQKFTIPEFSKVTNEEEFFEDIDIYLDLPNKVQLISEKTYDVHNVYLEKKVSDFVPDIILEIGQRKLLVEIAVTHFIDENKYKKIVAEGISVIEIDLSEFKDDFELEMLKDLVVTGVKYKRWIYNPIGDKEWDKWKAEFLLENDEERKLYELERKKIERLNKEYDKKQQKGKESREAFYLKNLKAINTHSINYIDNKTGELIPKVISHVSPCPEKNKYFNGEYYANIDTHCIRCKYFRGYRNERKHIICLANYYRNKDK